MFAMSRKYLHYVYQWITKLLLIHGKYEAQTITDALRIVRLKLLKCAGIALFTVTSSLTVFTIMQFKSYAFSVYGYKNIILQ